MRYLLLLILLCYMHTISAQNMIQNASFETNMGNNAPVGTCPSFSDVSMPGWTVSHGTPQLDGSGTAPDLTWFLHMWTCTDPSYPTYGEGVYNRLLTPVVNGEYYNICFWYKTSSGPQNGNGSVVCELTNQAVHNGYTCGGYPLIMTTQNITPPAAVFPQPVWTYVSWTFKANDNYIFMRVYPCCSTAPSDDIATLDVDGFTMYPISVCSGTLNMNNNVVYDPSVGFYERFSIIAGSSAALPNGTMMIINPAVSTIFKGNTNGYIDLVRDFYSAPDKYHYFETILGSCGCPGGSDDPRRLAQNQGEALRDIGIGIFPNPTAGSFTLKKMNGQPVDIEIFDLTGRSVFNQKNLTDDNITFDISDQPHGTYLVRIVTATEVKTIRLIKE